MNLRMCLNWKVLAGLAVVAVGVLIFAPHLLAATLPLLLLAACPLSMLVMAGGMAMMGGQQANGRALPAAELARRISLEEQLIELRRQLMDATARKAALEAAIGVIEVRAREPERLPAPQPTAEAEHPTPPHPVDVDPAR